jgi:dethiobiotin synthetase
MKDAEGFVAEFFGAIAAPARLNALLVCPVRLTQLNHLTLCVAHARALDQRFTSHICMRLFSAWALAPNTHRPH